jgi:hypothetical protein
MLAACAQVRFLIGEYCHKICIAVDPSEDTDAAKVEAVKKDLAVLQPAVDRVLHSSTTISERIVWIMRMFLLKSLDRERGLSFVRSALQQEPLSMSKWVMGWKDCRDSLETDRSFFFPTLLNSCCCWIFAKDHSDSLT